MRLFPLFLISCCLLALLMAQRPLKPPTTPTTPPVTDGGYAASFGNVSVPCGDVPFYHHEDPIGGLDGSIVMTFRAQHILRNGRTFSNPAESSQKTLASCSHGMDNSPGSVWLLRTRVWSTAGNVLAGSDAEINPAQPIVVKYEYKPGAGKTGLSPVEITLSRANSAWSVTSKGNNTFTRGVNGFVWKLAGNAVDQSRLAEIQVGATVYPLGRILGTRQEGCSAYQICHFHRDASGNPVAAPIDQCPVMVPPCARVRRPDDLPPGNRR